MDQIKEETLAYYETQQGYQKIVKFFANFYRIAFEFQKISLVYHITATEFYEIIEKSLTLSTTRKI